MSQRLSQPCFPVINAKQASRYNQRLAIKAKQTDIIKLTEEKMMHFSCTTH